jgi:hypothetical protein
MDALDLIRTALDAPVISLETLKGHSLMQVIKAAETEIVRLRESLDEISTIYSIENCWNLLDSPCGRCRVCKVKESLIRAGAMSAPADPNMPTLFDL